MVELWLKIILTGCQEAKAHSRISQDKINTFKAPEILCRKKAEQSKIQKVII